MINPFVTTIISKLNWALKRGGVDPTLLLQELDYGDPEAVGKVIELGEGGVALLVAKRFLGSVVRVLALEHSRVKNRFLEMQQARQNSQTGLSGFFFFFSTFRKIF